MGGERLTLTPVEPGDAKFQYPYPKRVVARIVHRRFQLLVKHPPGSQLEDYLVIRDETISAEAQQTNLPLLARYVLQDGALRRATGQYDADISLYLASDAAPKAEIDRWSYYDDAMNGPGLYHQARNAASDAANAAWIRAHPRQRWRRAHPAGGLERAVAGRRISEVGAHPLGPGFAAAVGRMRASAGPRNRISALMAATTCASSLAARPTTSPWPPARPVPARR